MAESMRPGKAAPERNNILMRTHTFKDLESSTKTQKKRIMSARPYGGLGQSHRCLAPSSEFREFKANDENISGYNIKRKHEESIQSFSKTRNFELRT